jgi:Na+/glutamate symporter
MGIISFVGGAGGAWGAANQRIKHTETEVRDTKKQLQEHDLRTRDMSTRLVRIETLLEQIDKRI